MSSTWSYFAGGPSLPPEGHGGVREAALVEGRPPALDGSRSATGAAVDPALAPYAAIAELREDRRSLQRRLEERERELALAVKQRRGTEEQIERLRRAKAQLEDQRPDVVSADALLQERIGRTQARLAEATGQRDDARRKEEELRSQVAQLESRLSALAEDHRSVQLWLKEWLTGSAEALRQLFDGTGVDLESLVARAADAEESGLGGPFEGMSGRDDGLSTAMVERIRELSALQKVASSLPLASPLDHFQITSSFGKRRDPFTRALAFHPGLDFGAIRGSEAKATAPGRVIKAGRSGPYGKLVEIDHGMGVITRYGHLKAVLVEKGDEVAQGEPIGVVGTTGRSTGRHLHYEIRIDEVALDPARFLEAGRYLTNVVKQAPTPIAAD